MRRLTLLCCLAVLAACAKSDEQPAQDTAAAMSDAPPMAAPITLADVAGKWAMRTMAESGDSTLVSYDLVATTDMSGWTLHFPKRAPIPVRIIAVAGDSIVYETGPYESVLRKGVSVKVHSVSRLQDGKLVGTAVARYATSGADSVAKLRIEGTRAQ